MILQAKFYQAFTGKTMWPPFKGWGMSGLRVRSASLNAIMDEEGPLTSAIAAYLVNKSLLRQTTR